MPATNISQTTTPSKVTDYRFSPVSPDSPMSQDENYYYNTNFTKWFGLYKSVAKIKVAINAYATWVLGKGFNADERTTNTLKFVDGWGEDTFNSILWNMLVTKKFNGDAYAHIIRDMDNRGQLFNLKPLNPEYMRHVVNKKGRIIRYDYMSPDGSKALTSYKPWEILHLCNDRVTDEIHGVSIIEAVQWNVEATEEARRAHRKMVKRNGVVRVIEVDTDNPTKIAELKVQWKDAIEKGDVLIIPKQIAEAKDWHGSLDTQGVVMWLKYLEDDFYTALGIPKVVLGGNPDATEAGAKVSYLAYEPIYTRETTELEADLFHQLGLMIEFIKPASMMDNVQSDQAANTGQTGFQPNDVTAGSGK